MSSTRKDSRQSPDGNFGTRQQASRNGVDSGHGQPPFGAGTGYDQRRFWNHSDYVNNGGKQSSQSNGGDYMNYYTTSSYAISSPYGGWTTGGGNAGGFYHPYHPQAVSSPVNSAYMDNLTFFGNGGGGGVGNGPPPPHGDHPGYYYDHFPSSNVGDYNTWGGPNFVAPPRTSASAKHAEFYHNSVVGGVGYGGGGAGYGREIPGGGGSQQQQQQQQQLEQNMSRMTMYDEPPGMIVRGGDGGGNESSLGGGHVSSNGSYQQNRTALGGIPNTATGGEAKKKSWATIASRPAKSSSGGGLLGLGRGKGRGVPIGGVPGSTKSSDHYSGSRVGGIGGGGGGGGGSSSATPTDSSDFWAAPSPQKQSQPPQQQQTAYNQQRNISAPTVASSSPGTGQEKRTPPKLGGTTGADILGFSSGGNANMLDYASSNGVTTTSTLYQQQQQKRRDFNDDFNNGADIVDGDAAATRPKEKTAETVATKTAGSGYNTADNGAGGGGVFTTTKKSLNEYNPKEFTLPTKGARYFVIKSYSEDDVHRSIKYSIWCSTDHGNKRLDAAYRERDGKGTIYLCFSVNASGHFCGVARMTSPLDYDADSRVWAQDKWKGQFSVQWIYVKDVPNQQLRHIRLENNENKPVTNSRDTQEVPPQKGRDVLKIIHDYSHATSLFDDFAHYEKRQEEENARKVKRGNNDY